MPKSFARLTASLPTTFALALGAQAIAQSDPQPPLPEVDGSESATVTAGDQEFRFTFGGGYTHRFTSDLDDGGGDISVDSLTGGLDVATDLNRDLSLTFRLNLGVSDYEFSGDGVGLGLSEPWETIHTIAFGAVASFTLDNSWSVFGGPVFQFSRESDADWGDSFTGGVIAGATYQVHEHLVLGGGLGVTSQIEEDVRIFPIIIVEWAFNEQWRVSSRGASGGRTSIEFTGVELIWMPSKQWEFALGAGSAFSRFRLDDDGVAPGGVGQDESTPLWLRASLRPSKTVQIDAIVGLGFGGEVSLDDEGGDGVSDTDYDTPLFVGLFGSIKF